MIYFCQFFYQLLVIWVGMPGFTLIGVEVLFITRVKRKHTICNSVEQMNGGRQVKKIPPVIRRV